MEENQRLDTNQQIYASIVKQFRKMSVNLDSLDLKLNRLTNPNVTDELGNTLLHKAVECLQLKSLDRLDTIITALHKANVRADLKNDAGEIPAALAHDEETRKRLFTLSYYDHLKYNPKGLALLQKDHPLNDKDMTLLTRTLKDIIQDELSFLGRFKEIIRVANSAYKEYLAILCAEYNNVYRPLFMACESPAIYALSEAELEHKEEAIVALVETYASTKQVIAEEAASSGGYFDSHTDLYASRMCGFYNELGKRTADVRLIKAYYQHPGIMAKARTLALSLLSPTEKTKLDQAYVEREAYLHELTAQRRHSYYHALSGKAFSSPSSSQDNSDSEGYSHSPEMQRANTQPMTIHSPKQRIPAQPELQPIHNRFVLEAVKSGNIELLEILLDNGLSFEEHEKRMLDQTIDQMTTERLILEISDAIVQQQIALIDTTMDNPKSYVSDQDFVDRFNYIVEQALNNFSLTLNETLAKQSYFWIDSDKFLLDDEAEYNACRVELLKKARQYSQDYLITLQNELKLLPLMDGLKKKLTSIQQKLAKYQPLLPSTTIDSRREHQEVQNKYTDRTTLEEKLAANLDDKYKKLMLYYSKHGKGRFPKEYQKLFEQRDLEMKTLGDQFITLKDKLLLMPILDANVDPNLTDSQTGERLLAIAVKQRNLAMVNILLKHHADPACRSENRERKSAFKLAMEHYHDKGLSPAEHQLAAKCLQALNEHYQQRKVDTRQVVGLQLAKQAPINESLLSLFNWANQDEFAPLKDLLLILEDLKQKLDRYGQSYLDRPNLPFFTRLRNGYYRDSLQFHRGETLASSYESLWNGFHALDLDDICTELAELKKNMRTTGNSQLYKAIDEALQRLERIDKDTRRSIKQKQRELLTQIEIAKTTIQSNAYLKQELAMKEAELQNSYQELQRLHDNNYTMTKESVQKDKELSVVKTNYAILEQSHHELLKSLEEKDKIITDQDSIIVKQNDKIALQNDTIIDLNEKLVDREDTIINQNVTIDNKNNMILEQGKQILEKNETIAKQHTVIDEKNKTIIFNQEELDETKAKVEQLTKVVMELLKQQGNKDEPPSSGQGNNDSKYGPFFNPKPK